MKAINFLFFLIFLAIGVTISVFIGLFTHPAIGTFLGFGAFFFSILLAIAIKIAYQWERAGHSPPRKIQQHQGTRTFLRDPHR